MSKNYVYYATMALCMGVSQIVFSQSGNISMNLAGAASVNPAILDLSDASNAHLGFLMPNVSLANNTDILTIPSPTTGMIVWNTNSGMSFGIGYYYWDGSHWDFLYNSGSSVAGSNLTAGTGVTSFTYNGTAPATVGLANTAIAPGGTFGSASVVPQITVNAQGQITGESNQAITPASIGMKNLTQGTGITAFTYNGSAIGSVGIANTTVSAGNYGSATSVPTYTVNAQGQLTGAANVPITGISTLNGGPIGAVLSNTAVNTPGWNLSPLATGQILLSNSAGVPTWLTTQANGILYSNAGTPAWSVLGSLPTGAGVLTVPNGGTGLSTITSNGLVYGNGTGNVNVLAPSATANYILQTTSIGGAPSWVNPATALTGTFILNQNASAQTANFWVTGAGTLGGLLTANGGLTVAGATNIVGATNINNTAAANTTNINNTSGNIGAVAIGNNSTTTLNLAAVTENINAATGAANATNIGTGSTTGNVSIGGASNNVLLPKFTTNNEVPYTSGGNGTIAMTGAPSTNNILSYNGTNPAWGALPAGSITANNGLNINTGNNVQLGGNLVQNTTVTNNGFTLGLAGSLETTTFASNGYVGIAIPAPIAPLQINNSNVATTAIFGPARPVCFVANAPMVGFNAYWGSSGPTYFSSAAACMIEFDQNVSGGLQVLTAPSGTAGNAATLTPLMTILNAGNVGIGTTTPTLAKLQTQGMVGNTVAYYSGSANSEGISLVSDWPGLYFNCYFNSGILAMSASGFPSIVNTDQSTGGITFATTATPNSVANAAVSPVERMRISGTGNVGIGTAAPNTSAALDITSTTQGFLPPRMTGAQMIAIPNPANGLMVYNTTTNCMEYYNGSDWTNLSCPIGTPGVSLDASITAAGSSTSFSIVTIHANDIILIAADGWPGPISNAAGIVKVDGLNATYINETGSSTFSSTSVWAYLAAAAGTHAITITETGLNTPYYLNFAAAFYGNYTPLTLANVTPSVIITGSSPISASITTTIANSCIFGTASYNFTGSGVTWTGLNQIGAYTHVGSGIDAAQAVAQEPAAGTYTITAADGSFGALELVVVHP